MLSRSFKLCTALLVVAPLAVGTPESTRVDSTSTRFYFGGGAGHYALVSRGCDEQVLTKQKRSFSELGGSLEHQRGKYRFGLRGGGIDDDLYPGGTNLYFNPYGALDWRLFAMELGYFWSQEKLISGYENGDVGLKNYVSARIRVGTVQGPYATLGWFDEMHFYSLGYAHVGIGGRPHPKLELWGGLSMAGPYDKTGTLFKVGYKPHPSFGLHVGTRLGSSEGIGESAITIGLTAHLPR